PEVGAPFVMKECLFLNREDFDQCPDVDGFFREDDLLLARLEGRRMELRLEQARNRATLSGVDFELELRWDPLGVVGGTASDGNQPDDLDTALLWRMKTVWESIYSTSTPNMLNSMSREA
ncbi:MAG: hypothetical protein HKM89_06725, partial [Gemmatimonadales bacterium]|nr:hypothetical protein [Gemmatimonadales bacterium]